MSKILNVTHYGVDTDFKNHLDNPDNNKILFSSKFGTGKSTFLQKFFRDRNADYINIILYPVDYSVANNDDVFELIKYDLLGYLIENYFSEIQLEKNDFSLLLVSQSYLTNDFKPLNLIKSIAKALLPKGKDTIEAIDQAKKNIYNEILDYKKKVETDQTTLLKDYFNWHEKRLGSVRESDHITQLITDLLNRIRNSNVNRSIVLTVDDLDRLDPQHIFRLFNIFSTHHDERNNSNKFGFDKVIFVADYDNLKNLYQNLYGKNVDFYGYIEKFYSTNIFKFDYRKNFMNNLTRILHKKSSPEFMNSEYFSLLCGICLYLIEYKHLNFRSLEKITELQIPDGTRQISHHDAVWKLEDFKFLITIKALNQLMTVEQLDDAFLSIERKMDPKPYWAASENWGASLMKSLNDALTFIVNPNDLVTITGSSAVNIDDQLVMVKMIKNKNRPDEIILDVEKSFKINYFKFYKIALEIAIKRSFIEKPNI